MFAFATIAAHLVLAAPAFSQTAPEFAVASIKPSTAESGSSSVSTDRGRVTGGNVTMKRCMRAAYDVPEAQIVGGPKWADEDRYDIGAKATVRPRTMSLRQ
jgi:uncharacterized protein (TIGR03435 family)